MTHPTPGFTRHDDTTRLEFLIMHSAWLAFDKEHTLCALWHRNLLGEPKPFMGYPIAQYRDARACIDAGINVWHQRLEAVASKRPYPRQWASA